jgi:hypothetical protein
MSDYDSEEEAIKKQMVALQQQAKKSKARKEALARKAAKEAEEGGDDDMDLSLPGIEVAPKNKKGKKKPVAQEESEDEHNGSVEDETPPGPNGKRKAADDDDDEEEEPAPKSRKLENGSKKELPSEKPDVTVTKDDPDFGDIQAAPAAESAPKRNVNPYMVSKMIVDYGFGVIKFSDHVTLKGKGKNRHRSRVWGSAKFDPQHAAWESFPAKLLGKWGKARDRCKARLRASEEDNLRCFDGIRITSYRGGETIPYDVPGQKRFEWTEDSAIRKKWINWKVDEEGDDEDEDDKDGETNKSSILDAFEAYRLLLAEHLVTQTNKSGTERTNIMKAMGFKKKSEMQEISNMSPETFADRFIESVVDDSQPDNADASKTYMRGFKTDMFDECKIMVLCADGQRRKLAQAMRYQSPNCSIAYHEQMKFAHNLMIKSRAPLACTFRLDGASIDDRNHKIRIPIAVDAMYLDATNAGEDADDEDEFDDL